MNKKLNIILLGALITCVASTSSAFATTGKVTGSSVRIREEASTTSSILATVKKGTEVDVEAEENDWYKVTYNDNTGYIYKDYVEVTLEDSSTEETEDETQDENTDDTDEVTDDEDLSDESNTQESDTVELSNVLYSDTDVYLTACYVSSKIGTLSKGDKINIEKTMANWSYVTYKSGSGWIPNYKLMGVSKTDDDNTDDDETDEDTSENPQKAYLSSTAANLRKGPGTSYEVIGGIAENEVLTVLSEEDGWYKVTTADNVTGYVLKSLVTLGEKKVTSRSSSSREIQVIESKVIEDSESKTSSTTTSTSTTSSSTKTTSSSSSTSSGSTNSADTTRKKLVAYAKKYLGYKYVYGGSSPSTGFDCSGFTKYVYGHYGYTLARSSSGQASNGTHVAKSDLKMGDLLIFSGHVGIYIGDNQFIHASNPSDGVKITSLSDSYYVKNYIDARRIIK